MKSPANAIVRTSGIALSATTRARPDADAIALRLSIEKADDRHDRESAAVSFARALARIAPLLHGQELRIPSEPEKAQAETKE